MTINKINKISVNKFSKKKTKTVLNNNKIRVKDQLKRNKTFVQQIIPQPKKVM